MNWTRRLALPLLLLSTALLYLVGLADSRWANTYYSAAAQAGSESWQALLLGSSDAANGSTIDKPPLSLWPMVASIRLFGLNSWSVLVPQAVIGVLAVWALVATVRRTTGSVAAGLLAGVVLALTPVAVLMFRFNNPDALLTLLLILGAGAVLRAIEATSRRPERWLALAGVLIGLAFLTKMMQAFLVLPALGIAYLIAGAAPLLHRFGHLLIGLATMLTVSATWVLLMASWPASTRPYIGSTKSNSILELIGGYNGLDRLSGDMAGASATFSEEAGPLRMFDGEVGGQVAWWLPSAVILLVVGLWVTRRSPRTDPVRAALVLWGIWLLVTVATFSAMTGVFHAYYTVALAPAIAALVGVGAHQVALDPRRPAARVGATVGIGALAFTGWLLLRRSIDFLPWLPWVVLAVGLAAAALSVSSRLPKVALVGALVAGLAGPAAYAMDTAATPYNGAVPVAGPLTHGRPERGPRGPNADQLKGIVETTTLAGLLRDNADDFRWVAAVVRSNPAGGYQLASGRPVMAMGGFNGSDPFPTLPQFQRLVRQGAIHYYIAIEPDRGAAAAWVVQNFEAETIDGVQVYDLTGGPQTQHTESAD